MPTNLEYSELASRYISPDQVITNVTKLGGGISNLNYRVQTMSKGSETKDDYVLTVYPYQSDWWKIGKERLLRDITAGDPEVLFPRVHDCGLDNIDSERFAFLLRQYVPGNDLDSALQLTNAHKIDWSSLCHDLGFRLASIHTHRTVGCGVISLPEQQSTGSWSSFMIAKITGEYQELKDSGEGRNMAGISTEDILKTEAGLVRNIDNNSLQNVTSSLTHGDTRFANIIATNQAGRVQVQSFIDLEWALSGDPEVDIAFVENWLHFSNYASKFNGNRDAFLRGYGLKRTPSTNYQEKRKIYHGYRSLNYLKNVFIYQPNDFLNQDRRYAGYIQKHLAILSGISNGKSLEDLGIQSLL